MTATSQLSVPALPREIWGLVAQELTNRLDFLSLFNFARVSRSMAMEALPLLYKVHALSPASTGDTAIIDTKKWAVLWRSILASSLVGGTMYPYCLWIKSLSLGNLHSLLEDLARDHYKEIRTWFFSAPLERFHILDPSGATRGRRTKMAIDNIIFEAADSITDYIKRAAKEADTTVGLTSLEGYHLPEARLSGWVSKLSLLTSLAIRDGSVLNSHVAAAIRENCPYFKELVCHFCRGEGVDADLSGFLQGLSPNTLASFTIMSHNDVGGLTYTALRGHSSSLKELGLYVGDTVVASLPLLSGCTNLVDLTIDVSVTATRQINAQEVRGISSWFQGCASLKKLVVANLPSTMSILADVLKVPSIRVADLDITSNGNREDINAFSSALATQTDMTSLCFRSRNGGYIFGESSEFINALCQCTKLRKLDLVTQMLNVPDFYKLAGAMQDLEEFGFDIDSEQPPSGDECLLALAEMHQLKSLNINASTKFTYRGLLLLLDIFGSHPPGSHQSLNIHIMRQSGTDKFSQAQMHKLNEIAARDFEGRIEVTYEGDPDELNESDFSD